MTTCIALDPNCEQCQKRAKRRECDGNCDDLCGMACRMLATPEGHAAIHAAERCRSCGHPKYDDDGPTEVVKPCAHGRCRNWHCANCDRWSGSDGPIACPCNPSWTTRALDRLLSWLLWPLAWLHDRFRAPEICQWCGEGRHVHDATSGACINANKGCEWQESS